VKLFFDQNLSHRLADKLQHVFPGSSQARLAGLDKASDQEIWEHARRNGYAIVTYDADFAERSALLGHPPKVLWLRCGNQSSTDIERLLRQHLPEIEQFGQDEQTGCLELY